MIIALRFMKETYKNRKVSDIFKKPIDEKVSVAPMVSYTNSFARHFYYLLAPDLVSYSEMIPATSLIKNPQIHQIKKFKQTKAKTVCQFAGNDANELIEVSQIAQNLGYDEVNINLGCPSKAMQKKGAGVCLMKNPNLLVDFYAKANEKINLPLTIKCRLGVDEFDSEGDLQNLIENLANSGCKKFIIHSRKAWLKGLNPAQNRSKPPIEYEKVYRLKQVFPHLTFIINGEIDCIEKIEYQLNQVDGVMIGREFIKNPLFANDIQNHFFKKVSLNDFLEQYFIFAKQVLLEHSLSVIFILKPLFGLAHHQHQAKKWRKLITEQMIAKNIDSNIIINQAKQMNLLSQ